MNRRNPYRLFDYYAEADAELFFGREREVSAVVGDILANKLLVLFARSGSGKTSLLKAGIGPALHQLGEDEASRIRLVTIRLEGDATPEQSALNALSAALGEHGPRPGESLHDLLRRLCSFPKDGALGKQPMGLVLAFDQFEELFITLFRDKPEVRSEFARQLAAIIYDDALRAYVVLSLRADHFHHLNEFRQAIPSIFQNNTNLELRPFDDEAALRVIRGPTERPGSPFTWEAGLPERIVADLKRLNEDQDGVLPIHLQIVCYGLVEGLEPGETVIAARLYSAQADQSASGESPAAAMIRRRILEPLEAVKGRERRRSLCRVLRALTTHHRTKQPRSFSGLSRLVPPARLQPILDHLESRRLVRQEAAATEVWYELRHDYLAREIASWLETQEQALKTGDRHRRIAAMALLAALVAVGVDLYLAWQSYTARLGLPGQPDELVLVRHAAFGRFEPAWWRREIATGLGREQLLASGVTNHTFAVDDALSDWREVESQLTPPARWSLQFATRLSGAAVSTNAIDAALFSALEHADADLYAMADERILDVMIVAARSGSAQVMEGAIETLGRLGPDLPAARSSAVVDILLDALKERDGDIRYAAADALAEFGPQLGTERVRAIVDELLVLVRHQDWDLGVHPARVLGEWNGSLPVDRVEPVVAALVDGLSSPGRGRREAAEGALSRLGAGLEPNSGGTLIHALLAALENQDPEVRRLALQLLNETRPEILANQVDKVVDAAVIALTEPDPSLRSLAVMVLRRLPAIPPDRNAAAASALTTAALKDPEPQVRFAAAAALGAFPDSLVPTDTAGGLAESQKLGLQDPLSEIRALAAYALGDFVAKVPADQLGSCVDALIEAQKDRDSSVRVAAAYALGRIAPGLPAERYGMVVGALLSALADREAQVLQSIAVAMGNCWARLPLQHVPSVVKALLAADQNRDSRFGLSTPTLLYSLGVQLPSDHGTAIVDALLTAVSEPGSDIAYSVAMALEPLSRQLRPDRVKPVMEGLVGVAEEAGWSAREAMERVLNNSLPQLPPEEVEPVFEGLLSRLADPDFTAKGVVLTALGALGPRLSNDLAGRAVDALVNSLEARDPVVRAQAARALGAWGPALPKDRINSVVEALLAGLQDTGLQARTVTAAALARIESSFRTRPAPSIILELERAGLGSERPSRHEKAAPDHAGFRALVKARWELDEPALLAALESDDNRWRVFALHVLARREGLAERTLNRIRVLREDARPWVRLAALRCLVELAREKQVQAFEKEAAQNPAGIERPARGVL